MGVYTLCLTPREIVFFYRQEFKSKGDFQRRGEGDGDKVGSGAKERKLCGCGK